MSNKIAFIGVGNMATATLRGITADSPDMSDIVLYNRHVEKIEIYRDLGAHIATSLEEAVTSAKYIMLCVKPQNFSEILEPLSKIEGVSEKVFISMAAGIATQTVSDAACGAAVIRVMPNTPMLIGKGVIAVCRNDKTSDEDFEYVCNIFESSGSVLKINENEMNRIICVTGSSPAYVFMMIKAMCDGARQQGLLDDDASLSEQDIVNAVCDTIIGAAELMKSGTKSPDEQIATVASKGGTTERAIAELERFNFGGGIISAMEKCTARADELGKK